VNDASSWDDASSSSWDDSGGGGFMDDVWSTKPEIKINQYRK
jgi:hypothetical protein